MLTVEIVNKIEQQLRYGEVIDVPITSMDSISLDESKFTLHWHKEPFPDRDTVSRAIVTALFPDHPISGMDCDWYMEAGKVSVTITLE